MAAFAANCRFTFGSNSNSRGDGHGATLLTRAALPADPIRSLPLARTCGQVALVTTAKVKRHRYQIYYLKP